jgi:hypothetical protein
MLKVSRLTEAVETRFTDNLPAAWYWAVSTSANPSFANTKSHQIGTDNLVAGGSEAQHIIIFGIGKKQGQSSFGGLW